MRPLLLFPAFCAILTLAACEETAGLPPPREENVIDTVSLWAISGTPIYLPSAYAIDRRLPVRPDQTSRLDFAFDIDDQGRALLIPPGAIDLGLGSGVQLTDATFENLRLAPTGGYIETEPVELQAGSVALARSPSITCVLSITSPLYAKMHVLAVDLVERRLDIEILANINCGYLALEPGLPVR
jgi:hypothetical protein